uniref:C2H2-type domain-containing protein n=1 Tax=Mimiviridae sp. ChoanoV1 TaxID=2596887 RepID=A0A5B8IEC8_9VIRU|nr:hypothetical protein 6_38 [Mimiviridae sp. ChoanoV1]
MVIYNCECCNYKTNLKPHYYRHLKTNKHKKNQEKIDANNVKSINNSDTSTKTHQKPPKIDKACEFVCEYCFRGFTRKDVLNKHIFRSCRVKKKMDSGDKDIKMIIEEHNKEKDKLYEYIDKLIDKTGDTNINIEKQMNNTINLNNFGEEDTSHITTDYKLKLLSLPYGMIQNMIEKIHFNNKKPENKNIALTNKRDNMIKVFRGSRWKYQDRAYVVDELIKNNYYRLDDFFECKGKNKMTNDHNKRYIQFQKKFDRQDDDLIGHIKRETEMIILSDNL